MVTGQNGSRQYGQNGMDKMVYGQKGIGQNGMEKMVWTKWYMDKRALDKMVWKKWYGQNDTILYVVYNVHFNSVEFNVHLVTKRYK